MKPEEINQADKLLTEPTEHAAKKKKTDGRENLYMSDRTCKLLDRKANARKMGSKDLMHALARFTRRTIRQDRKARAEAAAESACKFLEEGKIREAFGSIKGWYRDSGPRPP